MSINNLKKNSNTLRSVPVTFLSVMALLLIALGWLGWVLLEQDLSLKAQRIRERLDQAAFELENAIAHEITARQQSVEDIAASFTAPLNSDTSTANGQLTPNATLVHFSAQGITVTPETGLRYLPDTGDSEIPHPEFELADQVEFQQRDDQAALRLLKPLSSSPDESIQAPALMRIGRIHRRNGRTADALDAYQALAHIRGHSVNSVPANWLALYARCAIFSAENNMIELGAELKKLIAVLTEGGYRASASSYRYYIDAATEWAMLVGQPEWVEALRYPHSKSEMAARFFRLWSDWRQGMPIDPGILTSGGGNNYVLGFWTTSGSDLFASILTIEGFYSPSLAMVTDRLESQGIGWRISDATGQALLSSTSLLGSGTSTLRSLSAGGVAFTIGAFETAGMSADMNDTTRRRLLLTGLLLIMSLILVSTYFISRSLRREAEVSLLQSEFVAAVSHEFRTPLTSIRQLSELLASGRIESGDKAMAYYRILEKESARLQRLVEGLLDFGRMEAGARPYRPELLSCEAFLVETVTAFREEYDLAAQSLSLEIKGSPYISMDRESLTRSIWNLLDNAVKYSPDMVKIKVNAEVIGDKVHISVSDRGVGISDHEQSEVFNKFVRGSAARVTHAKGTGMGLAMVKKIIEDQGGTINARKNPGGGSVLTIVLASREPG